MEWRALGANKAICPAGHRIQIKELPKLAGKEVLPRCSKLEKVLYPQAWGTLDGHCKLGGAYKLA